MNWGILAFVIIYEVLTVVGVGLVIARKNKHSVEEGNFALAGKGLPTAQVGLVPHISGVPVRMLIPWVPSQPGLVLHVRS